MEDIKVQLYKERVWAKKLSQNSAKIKNNPLDPRVNCGDIIEMDDDHQFIKVLNRENAQAIIQYDCSLGLGIDYSRLGKYLLKNNIGIEGYAAGIAGIDFQMDRTQDEIREIMKLSPAKITHIQFKPADCLIAEYQWQNRYGASMGINLN